jgi:hypothetical protein
MADIAMVTDLPTANTNSVSVMDTVLQNTSISPIGAMETDLPSTLATSMGAMVMLVFFVEGLLGNLWILCSVVSYRKMWTVINIFIASLCVNDLLSLCLIVILIIDSYIWRQWTAGEIMCKLNPEFTVAFIGSSLWHTALIAIHRYVVVVHNSAYKKMKKRLYVVFVLVMARVIPIACTVPGFNLNTSGYTVKMLRCILLPEQTGRIISVTIIQVILPCLIIILCYVVIFTIVYRATRLLPATSASLTREIQITKMFGIIFLVILLGFIPYTAIRNADRSNRIGADVYVIVSVFYGVATCSSPLVYGIMSRDIRCACLTFLARTLAALNRICCKGLMSSDGYCPPTDRYLDNNAEMVTWADTETQTEQQPSTRVTTASCVDSTTNINGQLENNTDMATQAGSEILETNIDLIM